MTRCTDPVPVEHDLGALPDHCPTCNIHVDGHPCDRVGCTEGHAIDLVHLNPNIVRPLYPDRAGWRPYRYCRPHALAVVDPLR